MSNKHSVLQRCLDNTAPRHKHSDLGLFYFAKTFFPEAFYLPFGLVHYDMAMTLLDMYDPAYENRMERQRYILVHRGVAKTTTMTFLLPIYNIMLKDYPIQYRREALGWEGSDRHDYDIIECTLGERFILIVSETASVSENFVINLKNTIEERTDLIPYFGDKHPNTIEVDFEVRRKGDTIWRKNAFRTSDDTIVYGVGANQQVRGRNMLNSRPTLILADDMYSENNTKTPEARQKIDRSFFNGTKNSLDMRRGKIGVAGTMVHADTMFAGFRTSDQWKGVERPIISLDDLSEIIQKYTKEIGERLDIPSKERCKEIQTNYKSFSWIENYDLYSILLMYKENYEKGRTSYFFQEWMNIIRKEGSRTILRKDFVLTDMELKKDKLGNNIIRIKIDDLWYEGVCKLFTGVDIASSSKDSADDTVMCTVGISKVQALRPGSNMLVEKTVPFIYDIDGGKWGIYTREETGTVGLCNKALEAYRRMDIEMFTFEVAGQQGTIFNEFYYYLHNNKVHSVIKAETPTNQMNKTERIINTLLPIVQKYGSIYVNNKARRYEKFLNQIDVLGSDGVHDDYPDGGAYGFMYATVPIQTMESPKTFNRRVPINDGFERTKIAKDWEVM